jgi:hypothetical protein
MVSSFFVFGILAVQQNSCAPSPLVGEGWGEG